jgi:hypothetical protein
MATYILTAAQLNSRILNSFSIPAASAVPTVSDPNAQAFLNAAVITDVTQANAVNTLVIGLKADGLWTNMQALYPFVGGTATQHKYNLKDPRDLNVAYRLDFQGAWVHNANGAIGNGNTYADTFYTGMVSGEIGAYNRGGTLYLGGKYAENWQGGDYPIYMYPRIETSTYNNNYATYFSNSDDTGGDENLLQSGGTNLNIGLIAFSGGGGVGVIKWYKNGILNASLTATLGTATLPISLWLGGINYGFDSSSPSNYVFGDSQLAFAFITTTVLDGTQNTNLYNRVQTFQTALSRQV